MLLSLNCPSHPRSNYNETPSDLAMKNNHKDCLALLSNHIPPQPYSSRSSWFHDNLDREKKMPLDNLLLQSASAIDPDCRKHSLSLTLMKGLPDLMSSVISVAERDAYDLEVHKYHAANLRQPQ
ncbi:hypothetical protein AVEN_172618-1 [Araneus ventricosus]|uniref:Uncharacterized protein n=1 Tax=Araneus ventricosus TaxID=182803 RepID=A0A4Y2NEP3_ARAVE|nr:hypothetical protein AVEN_172618-1 [Araneus ventricosus]